MKPATPQNLENLASAPFFTPKDLQGLSASRMEPPHRSLAQAKMGAYPSNLLIASTFAADAPFGSNSEASHISTIALASSGPITRAPIVMICALLDLAALSAE